MFQELKGNRYKIIGTNALLKTIKGLRYIIEVLPLLTEYVFVFVGDGPQKKIIISCKQIKSK
jgi:glycosyltransferase involved in cell wall biosynthesis